MSNDNTMSLCLSFQLNNATAHSAGLLASGFGAALRPSLGVLVAGTAGLNAGVAPIMAATPAGLPGSTVPMCLLDKVGIEIILDPKLMMHGARVAGSIEPQYSGIAMPQGGTGTNDRRNEVRWFNRKLFINKTYNGKHYSRPDGLPPSPPPKRRRRYTEEGGIAES